MKQIEVRILQQSYLLTCPQGHEQRLLEAVERVDSAMTRIRDAGKVRARERIAVLAALNLAFEVFDREAARQAAELEASASGAHPAPSADGSADPTSAEETAALPAAAFAAEGSPDTSAALPAPGLFDQGALPLEESAEQQAQKQHTQQRIDALLQRLDHALDGGARAA
ncbi:cell division protein ZapA [Acidovorax sp. Leaf160]|uniref:cell division protein ZapA n=1 Tax=Acidovorax sp. Leaf160 TaxID=1736280 RepID=UPI0009E9BA76|nr:cell division protein ZapA [Acidovorax sp. Leaf160]